MDLSFETIDALRAMVGKVSTEVFAKIPPKQERGRRHDNNFQDDPLNGRMPDYHFADGGDTLVVQCGSQWANFYLKDVRIRSIDSIVFSEPVLTNRKTESINVKSWSNAGDTKETHVLTTKKSTNKTIVETSATEFGTKITQSLRTKVSGGIPGVGEAEVETGLDIESHFNQQFGKSVSKSTEESEMEEKTYRISPWTKTTLKREEGTSDYQRTVKTTGILEASLYIESHGDFYFPVDSFVALERIIKGGHANDVDWHIANYFKQRHFQNYVMDYSPLHLTVEETINVRNIQSSEIERIDTPLK